MAWEGATARKSHEWRGPCGRKLDAEPGGGPGRGPDKGPGSRYNPCGFLSASVGGRARGPAGARSQPARTNIFFAAEVEYFMASWTSTYWKFGDRVELSEVNPISPKEGNCRPASPNLGHWLAAMFCNGHALIRGVGNFFLNWLI